jgi:hypothetical protein
MDVAANILTKMLSAVLRSNFIDHDQEVTFNFIVFTEAFILHMDNDSIFIYHAMFPAAYLTSMLQTGKPTGSVDLKRLSATDNPQTGFNIGNGFQNAELWNSLRCVFCYLVSGEARVGYLQQNIQVPMVSPKCI